MQQQFSAPVVVTNDEVPCVLVRLGIKQALTMMGIRIEPYSRWNSLAASAAVRTSGSTSFDQSPSYLSNLMQSIVVLIKNAITVIANVSSGDSSTQQHLNPLDSDE